MPKTNNRYYSTSYSPYGSGGGSSISSSDDSSSSYDDDISYSQNKYLYNNHFKNSNFIFTDGSAVNNGKRNCKAGWSNYVGVNDPRNKSGIVEFEPTNQKAELLAIQNALETVVQFKTEKYTIVTDSKYSFDCLTKWYKNWEKNGYLTKQGTPVKHSNIIKLCVEKIKQCQGRIQFVHVNSHQPKKSCNDIFMWDGNNEADKMARNVIYSVCV